MIQNILKKVDALPPLPKTILELQDYKKAGKTEPLELLQILQKDPLILATLLKIANSAMFGFSSKVETPKKAIELIGVNFTLSIAFGSAIKSSLKTNPKAYGLTADSFIELANMSSNLLHKWYGSLDATLKESLLMPVFLQETGKFILSDIACEEGNEIEFLDKIKQNFTNIAQIEKEYFGYTSSEVTSMIFKQWGLDEHLINTIKYVSNIDQASSQYKQSAQILNIIQILCNCIDPLNDKAVDVAINKAKEYNLYSRSLEKAIETMQDRLLDA